MIRYRMHAARDVPCVLLLSARAWKDVLFRDELLALHELRRGFALVLTLTREPPRRDSDYGRRIDTLLVADALTFLPGAPKHIFICGSNSFVNGASDGAISAGLPSAAIRTERYGV